MYSPVSSSFRPELRPSSTSCSPFCPLCTAKFPTSGIVFPGKTIVPPGTEALIYLFIKNAKSKWEAMFDHEVLKGFTNKKLHPFPRWSKLKPDENVQWKTLYSDQASGQSSFGGWKVDGLREYARLVAMMKQVRKNKTLCLKVDTEIKDRLFAANQAYWDRANRNIPRPEALDEEEEEIEFEVEDDDDDDEDDEEDDGNN
jgi:hypothetical protein